MKSALVLGLLLLAGFAFADAPPPRCSMLGNNCMENCCTDVANGTPEASSDSLGLACAGGNTGKFETCATMLCRANTAECLAPGSECGMGYATCFTGCRNGGGTNLACDETCWGEAGQCIADANGGGECCGPVIGILAILGGVFMIRRK